MKNDCFLLIQVFPFTSSARVPVMNMIIFLKSEGLRISRIQNMYGPLPEHLFHFAPSLATTFPSLNLTLTPKEQKEEDEEEMGELALMEEQNSKYIEYIKYVKYIKYIEYISYISYIRYI